MKTVFQFTINEVSILLRGRLTLFWTIAFPAILLIIQMALFGNGVALDAVKVRIQDLDDTQSSHAYSYFLEGALAETKMMKIEIERGDEAAKKKQSDLLIVLPKGMELNASLNRPTQISLIPASDSPSVNVLTGILRGVTDNYNIKVKKYVRQIEFNTIIPNKTPSSIPYSLYVTSGLCIMTIISTGLMGFGVPLVAARENGQLRLFQMYPISTGAVLLAWWLSRVLIVLMSSVLLFGIAYLMYGVRLHTSPITLAFALGWVTLGACVFLALGLLVAAISPNLGSATILSNLIYFPVLFTGNLLMPTGGLPAPVRSILDFAPANIIVLNLRRTLSGEFNGVAELRTAALLGLATIILLTIAQSRFKWSGNL